MSNGFKIDLETERLRLRNVVASDKEFLISLWQDPVVTQFMGGPRSSEMMEEELGNQLSDPFAYEYDLWPVIEKTTGSPIGHCGILEKEVEGKNEYEVTYVLSPSYWGRGYATEIASELIRYAFEEKGLNRIIALIKPGNAASAQVAKRIGMHKEKSVIRGEGIVMDLFIRELM